MACALGLEPFPLGHTHVQRQPQGHPLPARRPPAQQGSDLACAARLGPAGSSGWPCGRGWSAVPVASLQPSEPSGSPCFSWQEQTWAQTSCQPWTGYPNHPYLLSFWQRRTWWGWGRALLSLGSLAALARALSPYSMPPHAPHVGFCGHPVGSDPDLGKGEWCL